MVKRQKWGKQEDGSKALVDRPRRVKRWWRIDGAGNGFVVLRYGNKVLSPKPDKGAISVGDKGKLPEILEAVISAVRAEELDAVTAVAKRLPRLVTSAIDVPAEYRDRQPPCQSRAATKA